jgi:hypothetical protein
MLDVLGHFLTASNRRAVPYGRLRASVRRIIALTVRKAGTGGPVNHLKQTKLQKDAR